MGRRGLWVGLVILAALGSQECVAADLALLGGAGTVAGQGVPCTLDSIAYKTFTVPGDDVEAATLRTLDRMDIEVKSRDLTDSGITIEALAGDRNVSIELDRLTSRSARMDVKARPAAQPVKARPIALTAQPTASQGRKELPWVYQSALQGP